MLIALAGLVAAFAIDAARRRRARTSAGSPEQARKLSGSSEDAHTSTEKSPAQVSQDLRLLVLETPQGPGSPGEPFAIIMDIAYPEAVASVMASTFGDASIYFSTGGGIIGGVGHESVREAATAFIKAAAPHVRHFPTVSCYPFPTAGKVRFYVRTPDVVHMAEAGEKALGEGNDPLSPLFYAGQEVITQLRLVSSDLKGAG